MNLLTPPRGVLLLLKERIQQLIERALHGVAYELRRRGILRRELARCPSWVHDPLVACVEVFTGDLLVAEVGGAEDGIRATGVEDVLDAEVVRQGVDALGEVAGCSRLFEAAEVLAGVVDGEVVEGDVLGDVVHVVEEGEEVVAGDEAVVVEVEDGEEDAAAVGVFGVVGGC